MAAFGEKLKAIRMRKDWTQEEMANFLDTTKQTISRYELGLNSPRLDTLASMAEHFEINMTFLVDDYYSIEDTLAALDNKYLPVENLEEIYPDKNIEKDRQYLFSRVKEASDKDTKKLAQIWKIIEDED